MRVLLIITLLAAGGATAAETPAENRLAIKALGELARICEADGMLLWRKSLCGPMVLVNTSTRAAIANRPDPDGKFRKDGDVYIGTFPAQFTPSNTSIQWNDQAWSTVMLPLPADPFRRLRLLAHESFHRIQPGLGLSASDQPNAHLDTEAGRLWLRLELRALSRALRLDGEAARRSAADAMLFRMYRHRICSGSETMEAAMEEQEGLPEYTGVFVALRETGEDINREAREIEAREDSDAFARSFGYATGPALGLLLDRYAVGWRTRVATTPLDAMLISALHVQLPQIPEEEIQKRAKVYGYASVVAAENEREERHKALLAELTRKFLEGSTLDFPRAPELRRTFDPGALVPFPPYGTYYPSGTFTASWGRLRVDSDGALLAPDNQSLRLPAPMDPAARPVRGTGWVLQLEPGWTIRAAGREGTFVVVLAEQK
jgi:hypothetical protein